MNDYMNSMPYGYQMPTPQPYNYAMQPYYNRLNQIQAQQQTQQPNTTNTNKIFVNGIDDVRNRLLPPNSDYYFLDNDKPLIYQKIVDSKGQFEVKTFQISPYQSEEIKETKTIDLSEYVKKADIEQMQTEIKQLRDKLNVTRKLEVSNGTGTTTGKQI